VTDPEATTPAPTPDDGAGATVDGLDELRAEVDSVDELPVADRVAVFERVNDGIAAELSRLDEV
jgi:hypothetical protein